MDLWRYGIRAALLYLSTADLSFFRSNVVLLTTSYILSTPPLRYSTHLATFHLGEYLWTLYGTGSNSTDNSIAIPITSTRHFSSLARRLSRIFAHAYFHHRELFEQAEAENALYERFLGLVRHFGLVQAEFLVIDWEGRPPRKAKATADQTYERHGSSDVYGGTSKMGADSSAGGVQARTILTRDHESSGHTDRALAVAPEDAALNASPSSGALGRRRTDTMYMADDLALAALDSVLSGDADVSTLDNEVANKEASQDETELEMVESVDPFKDENEVTSAGDQGSEPQIAPDDVVVAGDVENGSDVVVPIEPAAVPEDVERGTPVDDDSWPDAEILEEEAAEAVAEGQLRGDVVPEPAPTPAEVNPVEEESKPVVPGAEDAVEEEKTTGDEEEAGTTLPEDVNSVDIMLKSLEERNAKLEELTGSPPAADAET